MEKRWIEIKQTISIAFPMLSSHDAFFPQHCQWIVQGIGFYTGSVSGVEAGEKSGGDLDTEWKESLNHEEIFQIYS